MAGIKGRKKNGQTNEAEYWSWVRMRRRCLQPSHKSFKDYGGRGITICPEWANDYYAFLSDMGRKPTPAHTVERIDNNGNYEPSNCRWAPRSEQARNRRNAHRITYGGETMCLTQWAERIGLNPMALTRRLAVMPVEQALDPSIARPRAA